MTIELNPASAGKAAIRAWPRAQFAYREDPRFSFCIHVPQAVREGRAPERLLVAVHQPGAHCEWRHRTLQLVDHRGRTARGHRD